MIIQEDRDYCNEQTILVKVEKHNSQYKVSNNKYNRLEKSAVLKEPSSKLISLIDQAPCIPYCPVHQRKDER